MNRLHEVAALGQSIWLDSISRSLLESGELARRIEHDGLRGLTSNPALFEKAIAQGGEYRAAIEALRRERPRASTHEVYEALVVRDIQDAAAALAGVHHASAGADGFVSLEVSLHAGDTRAAILREARHLSKAVQRPNLMVKVPGTAEGIAAFEELTAEGISVNVTLLFSIESYLRTAEAWQNGLERWIAGGGDPRKLASVASFFVSRIDTAVDAELERLIAASQREPERGALRALLGRAAIANAKLAYARSRELAQQPRWKALAARGARPQRLLWASTGTKNKAYRDVLYIEELIGPDTVNTAPPATIDAFRDHGRARPSLEQDVEGARAVLRALEERGISLARITDELLADGLRQFSEAFTKLIAALERPPSGPHFEPALLQFPAALAQAHADCLADWQSGRKLQRLLARDARLWTGGDEARWLGWLDAPERGLDLLRELESFAADVRGAGFTHALLLGMGGSSLCPEVLARTLGTQKHGLRLEVLDSTDPEQVRSVETRVDMARTLFVVASKSGSTLEPSLFEEHFWARAQALRGAERAAESFVAITDPGSQLEALARRKGYRRVFHGVPEIGGRFSALSAFGLVPAALLGLDLATWLARAREMQRACAELEEAQRNPGLVLGAALGCAARAGRDKLTLLVSPALESLGGWLEQLVAESTGKQGLGIIPVDLEPLGAAESYGHDRLFVYVRDAERPDARQDERAAELARLGHPLVRIPVANALELGAEFYRWEIATAVAGALLGIHPFDQPDVEASKIATKALTSAYERTGALPSETPILREDGLAFYAAERDAAELAQRCGPARGAQALLRAHFERIGPGDYAALLAYLEMKPEHVAALQELRAALRDARRAATCLGFGPRFLHSTGQAYKGGPASGVFLQLTCAYSRPLPIPNRKLDFATVIAAQARGDFEVLVERERRALRVHFEGPVGPGLARLVALGRAALRAP
jgi:transaldolase/glucose-6-phosphate isomerase